MPLPDQQRAFFETFGFLVFPGLFAAEIADITNAFETIWASHGGGHAGQSHDGKARSAIVPFADQHELLCSLLDDPRIDGVVSALLGDDYNYYTSDGNYYVGDTSWHSDGWRTGGYRHLKIAFYLDPVGADTGCLRVIPGSHRVGDSYADTLQKHSRQSEDTWSVSGRDLPAFALESQPGDMVVFDQNLKHSSFGGGARRRMFTLNFTPRYRTEDMDELRQVIAAQARFWIERNYGETMVTTASPARMRHLEQIMAHDGHLAALARDARARMSEPSRH